MNKLFLLIFLIVTALTFTGCSSIGSLKSKGSGMTDHEVYTESISINNMDLDIDPEGITYTIDISTREGRMKLNGLNLKQAKELALQEAAMMNNAARIVSPKFTHLTEGNDILRITVFGFPARYKRH